FVVMFFFSSRRRHTRFSRDWSSDVCSSDLAGTHALQLQTPTWTDPLNDTHKYGLWAYYQGCLYGEANCTNPDLAVAKIDGQLSEIGRASCRERGESAG